MHCWNQYPHLGITSNTIALIGSALDHAQGEAEPNSQIAALGKEKNLLCHVDARIGVIVLSVKRETEEFTPPPILIFLRLA